MQLYRLNVSRSAAGRDVPFDRVYLAHGEARKAVKALFDYALVLPLTDGLREQLVATQPFAQRTLAQTHRPGEYQLTSQRSKDWAEVLTQYNDWVLVVPVLPKNAKAATPSYLVNARWYTSAKTRKARSKESPIPSLAYLQTPTENFRPACIACPRFSEHQAGLCQLGQPVCYTTLVLGDLSPRTITETPPDLRDLGVETP